MINLYVSASTDDKQYDMAETTALVMRAIPHYDMRHVAEVRQAIGHYKGKRENTIILTLSSDRPWLAEGMAADLADNLGQETVLVAHIEAPKRTFGPLDTLPDNYTRRLGIGQPAYAYLPSNWARLVTATGETIPLG